MTRTAPDRIVEHRAMLLGGLRRVHTFSGAAHGIPEQWQALGAMLPLPGQQGATMYGVMCGADPQAQSFEYMTGVEVAALDALGPGSGGCGDSQPPSQPRNARCFPGPLYSAAGGVRNRAGHTLLERSR